MRKAWRKRVATAELIISEPRPWARRAISLPTSQGRVRVDIWLCPLRRILYLHYRFRIYLAPQWAIILGKEETCTIREAIGSARLCCGDSGVLSKIRRYVNSIPEEEKDTCFGDTERCLPNARTVFDANGHYSNANAEGELRDCATLLLKHPFRSVTYPFLQRDRAIKCAYREHRRYYSDFRRRFFARYPNAREDAANHLSV